AGDYECALDAAQTAISLDPERVDAINSSSVLLRELGRLEESAGMLDEYEKQLGDQPTWQQRVALQKNRGIWAFQSGQYPDAVRFLEAADAELQPMIRSNNQPSPYEEEIVFYLARSRESQGEQAKACDLYRRYQNLVQGCGPGETERRDFAVSKAASAECVKG
ncbi:MAG: tetratricopeptide repeat protein, partial [Anaerolineae bacterium]|nr:tetratricopeptide repeat protein [Anaerolineae bacterium]